MIGLIDNVTVTISLQGIEILTLKKLSLVSHALASRLSGEAGREQKTLAATLDDVVRRIELAAAGNEARP